MFSFRALGASALCKQLSQCDAKYASLFNDVSWRDAFERSADQCGVPTSSLEPFEINARLQCYLNESESLLQIPISEAILTAHKVRRTQDEDTSQIFVPFLGVTYNQAD